MTEIWINRNTGEILVGEMLKIGNVAGEFVEYNNKKEVSRIYIEFRKNYERIF